MSTSAESAEVTAVYTWSVEFDRQTCNVPSQGKCMIHPDAFVPIRVICKLGYWSRAKHTSCLQEVADHAHRNCSAVIPVAL